MQLRRRLTGIAIALMAAGGLAGAGFTAAARADSGTQLGGDCPGEPSAIMTTDNDGDVSISSSTCGGLYPEEAAVEWHTCIPDPENLTNTCSEAEWSYGPEVTSGTSSVSAEALFNVQDNAGFRYLINGQWILINEDNQVVSNPI